VGEGVTRVKIGDRIAGCFHPRWFGGPIQARLPDRSAGREGPANMSGSRIPLIAAYRINAGTDRFRDRGLTVLLVLELCLLFLAAPLGSDGPPIMRPINETMVLAVVATVVLLSRRREAIAVIVLGGSHPFWRAPCPGWDGHRLQRVCAAAAATSLSSRR
jgi:hypothetical protein